MKTRHFDRLANRAVAIGLLAALSATTVSAPALAQDQRTPKDWSYEIRNGQRVPKAGNRVTRPDGSWREEVKQGNCVTIKEKSASGEYKETRQCNPN